MKFLGQKLRMVTDRQRHLESPFCLLTSKKSEYQWSFYLNKVMIQFGIPASETEQ